MLKRLSAETVILTVLAIFALGIVGGYYISQDTASGIVPLVSAEESSVEMLIPAVDTDGKGVTGKLITIVRPASIPGSGQVLVSVNSIVSQFDTQISARTAVKAAEKYTGIKTDNYDVVYVIDVNADAIEGPSAGASMAISAVAALQKKQLDPTVAITGTIREDGSIGPVGSVKEKLDASKLQGVTTFLVSKGLSNENIAERIEECTTVDGMEYCKVEYNVMKIAIEDGVKVTEVSSLDEAVPYFIE
jgi:predicted S18 family serine protease